MFEQDTTSNIQLFRVSIIIGRLKSFPTLYTDN